MEYKGQYKIFDPSKIKTYPLSGRNNKVKLNDLIDPDSIDRVNTNLPEETVSRIDFLAEEIISAKQAGKPVVFFTGAHLVKNGLSKLLGDLINKDLFTMISGNGATSIHDFELGLIGETSEYVPQALEKGEFGMAFEFNYINAALMLGNRKKLGYGESIGKLILDSTFREEVEKILGLEKGSIDFKYPEISLQAICYGKKIPFTVHAGIGTDVTDQHPYFDGETKGGCSGRDFLLYADEISRFTDGGLILNVGSAVTGPEVFLKAASMAGNIGKVPNKIITANFDLRPYNSDHIKNDSKVGYYYRDQKSIVTRVPEAYGGKGYYIGGDQKQTIPILYKKLIELV
ncbi:MAG: hypothetical protein QNK30_03700 [Bacteroidales bacterium]|nr:hypothetical protein [Bacteroidales bacterium]